MASAESQKPNQSTEPTCPVCNRSDKVMSMRAAANSGVARCAAPEMPGRYVSMLSYILPVGVLVAICVIVVLVIIGSGLPIGDMLSWIIVSVTLAAIILALVVSYMAFDRVVKKDAEAALRFPAWDRATETWKGLAYCSRDDAVFDPKTNQRISNEQLKRLRASEEGSGVGAKSQSAMATH